MNKNNITVSDEILRLLLCPICGTRFTNYIKYLTCERNHTYDFSKTGYLNFLKKNKNAVYHKALFKARKQIAKSGFFEGIEQLIVNMIMERYLTNEQLTILDMGSGDGTVFLNILSQLKQLGLQSHAIGVDISKEGALFAGRSDTSMLWLVTDIANAPITKNSIDVILNTLSPANYKEFNRLLKDDGIIIKTIPDDEYLIELRQANNLNDYSNEKIVSLFSENTLNDKSVRVNYQRKLKDEERKLIFEMTPLTEKIEVNEYREAFSDIVTVDMTVLKGEKKPLHL